jgi:hypothetical protein
MRGPSRITSENAPAERFDLADRVTLTVRLPISALIEMRMGAVARGANVPRTRSTRRRTRALTSRSRGDVRDADVGVTGTEAGDPVCAGVVETTGVREPPPVVAGVPPEPDAGGVVVPLGVVALGACPRTTVLHSGATVSPLVA